MSENEGWHDNQGKRPTVLPTRIDVEMMDGEIRIGVRSNSPTLSWTNSSDNLVLKWRPYSIVHEDVHMIARNGYSTTEKQARYCDDNGEDLIDEWARTRNHDEFRAIMFAQIEKYQRRLGKKDTVANETGKMLDYMRRWHEQEKLWDDESND